MRTLSSLRTRAWLSGAEKRPCQHKENASISADMRLGRRWGFGSQARLRVHTRAQGQYGLQHEKDDTDPDYQTGARPGPWCP